MVELKGVLIDTDILIDISKNKLKAVNFFDNLNKKDPYVFVSVISAISCALGLATTNKRHFSMIKDLFLIETY